MAALIGSRPDLVHDFHRTLAPELIHRFKEREENVKADVFGAYIVLLRQTRPPKGWLEAVEEPTQTGSNLHMLRGQVGMPSPVSHASHLLTTLPAAQLPILPPAPPSGRPLKVHSRHLLCALCVRYCGTMGTTQPRGR